MTTVKGLAERLQVSRWTVYRMVRSGEIGCVRVGAMIRFTDEQIRHYLRARRVPMTDGNGRRHV